MAPLCWDRVESRELDDDLDGLGSNCTRFSGDCGRDGLLIGGLYITSAIAQPTMGRLADRLGARRVFLAGLYLVALAGVAGTFAPSLRALIWVRVLLGVGSRGLSNGDENSAQPGGTDWICQPRMALGILVDERTLHRGDRSGARRNTHRPRWLEDGLSQ